MFLLIVFFYDCLFPFLVLFVLEMTLKPCWIDLARRAVKIGTTIIQTGWQEAELRPVFGWVEKHPKGSPQ